MKNTHQEYSFHLATCNLSERTRTVRNPFTSELLQFPIDDGFSAEECRALRELMQDKGFIYTNIPGEGYVLALSRDERLRLRVELEIGQPDFAVEIVVRSLTDSVLDLVLSVARAGNCALTSCTGDDVLLNHELLTPLMAARWPDAPVVRTRADLRHWLEQVIGSRSVRVDPV